MVAREGEEEAVEVDGLEEVEELEEETKVSAIAVTGGLSLNT